MYTLFISTYLCPIDVIFSPSEQKEIDIKLYTPFSCSCYILKIQLYRSSKNFPEADNPNIFGQTLSN